MHRRRKKVKEIILEGGNRIQGERKMLVRESNSLKIIFKITTKTNKYNYILHYINNLYKIRKEKDKGIKEYQLIRRRSLYLYLGNRPLRNKKIKIKSK